MMWCGCWHDRFTPEHPNQLGKAHRREAYRMLDAAEIRERARKQKPGRKAAA